MQTAVEATRERVRQMLAESSGGADVLPGGELTFLFESVQVFLNVLDVGENMPVVNVFAVTNVEVPPSPQLYRFVATKANDWVFGHLGAREEQRGVTIMFRHTLLGEYLDRDELAHAVHAVATTADGLDNEIKRQFGGKLFREP